MLKLVIPCFGDHNDNLPNLIKSLDNQKTNFDFECYFLEDQISTDFKKSLKQLSGNKFFIENSSGKRCYALKNISNFLDTIKNDCIIGVIDGDDFLWGNDCLQNIKNEYDKGYDIVWTANYWDKFALNHSGPYDNTNKDPYSHPWVSSHFKTFKLFDFKSVSKKNFKNKEGEWFEACYDQALMLPIIWNVMQKGGKTKYIDKNHYIYRGDIKESSEFRKKQLDYESYIRTRGYVK